MKFLGIRNGHDSNITYTDGVNVRYIKFERNLQIKHYNTEALEKGNAPDDIPEMLRLAKQILGVDFADLNAVCINNSPDFHPLKRDIQINQNVIQVDKGEDSFWDQFSCPVYKIDHHYAHALSCWPLIDLETVANHLVVDGEGEHARTLSIFDGNYTLLEYIDGHENNPGLSKLLESIGLQWGMKGIKVDISGKVMALKSFHQVPADLEKYLLDLITPLKYRNLMQFVNYCQQVQKFISPMPDEKQQLINIAYMLHRFAEVKMPDYFQFFAPDTNLPTTYSGGTAQNTVVNTSIRKRYPNLHIPPHCPDDGISLGCVEFLRQHYQQPHFSRAGFPYWQSDVAPVSRPSKQVIKNTAEMLARGKIVGWYQGYGEVGPRALGNRSILMDPSVPNGKDIINRKVKKRESYRPFGASVLLEDSPALFDCDYHSPYMLYVVDCKQKEMYPSIVHVDGSCRIQTVNQQPQTEDYYELISEFKKLTGIPVLLNTSLNVDGKPIAGSPNDGKTLFETSELDALVVGDAIAKKD